jgi:3-hydroxybutyryl-CoA dehydratase
MLRHCARRAAPRVIRLGDEHSVTRAFTAADVAAFAQLCGDTNEVHLSADAARRAGFDGCIVHGILVASLFSYIMGMHLPGPQSIYMQQSLNFRAPVYVGQSVTATVKVTNFDAIRGYIFFETRVVRDDGKVAVDGKALGRNKIVTFEKQEPKPPRS